MSTELPKISTGLPPEDTLNDEERLRIRKNCRNLMSYPNTCSHECRYPSSESGDCSSPCWQLGRAVQASSPSSPYLPVIPLSAFVTVYYYGSANCVISFVCLSSNQVFTMRKLVMKATDGGAHWCRQRGKERQARLAQSVERQALNLVVGGSSPPVGDSFDSHLFIHPKTLFSAVEQCFYLKAL